MTDVLYNHIRARCDLCGWKGALTELLDFDEQFTDYEAEYCPNCHSPYVVYDKFSIAFGNTTDEMD